MTSEALRAPPGRLGSRLRHFAIRHWPSVLGFLILAVPTLISLGAQSWTTELGAHGPIVLVTGLWLIFELRAPLRAAVEPGKWLYAAPLFAVALPLYAFGRAFDFISLEVIGLYLVIIALTYVLIGFKALRVIAFPLLYLGFLIPPPGWLVDQATAPLQQFVSYVSTGLLDLLGYPIQRSGVTIYIAQYQLLVEQACSGMNSIVGLTAITLFYIYVLHRASWRYATLLMFFILPIAVLANILRVTTLVLITYHLGDAAAQGFLHVTTGMVLFFIALVLVFGLDSILQAIMAGRRIRRAKPVVA